MPGSGVLERSVLEPGRVLRDVQRSGPFKWWVHTRRFSPAGSGRCRIEDVVEWEAPMGGLGGVLDPAFERSIERVFGFQHARISRDLRLHRRYGGSPLRVAVTGSSGLLGRALAQFLRSGGHHVIRVTRSDRADEEQTVYWNPASETLHRKGLEGLDAVVHLAGEPIAALRWTGEKKKLIRESRVDGTALLSKVLAGLESPPPVLISGSAIGYYGDRGDEVLDERSPAGTGFLADVVQSWEGATKAAEEADIRVVHARTGIALSSSGGVLGLMARPFSLGIGGRLGDGEQYMSWVDVDDWIGMVLHAIRTPGLTGPMNLTAPTPVTNAEFTETLGSVMKRPTAISVPARAVDTLSGEAGRSLALEGQRVMPAVAQQAGYGFLSEGLETALRFQLGRA